MLFLKLSEYSVVDVDAKRYPQNSDLELGVGCTGLLLIKLTLRMARLTNSIKPTRYDEWEDYPRSVEEMWTFYRFYRLLDC